MPVSDLLAQLAAAFGETPPIEVLAQDLASAAARRLDDPKRAEPVDYSDPGMDPELYLFAVYAWSLPWLEPDALVRHAQTLMRLALAEGNDDDAGYTHRSFQAFMWLLSPDNPAVIRPLLRRLWRPLTVPQRACIAAYAVAIEAPQATRDAWARVAAHDAGDDDLDWFEVFWPLIPTLELEALLELWASAFGTPPWESTDPPVVDVLCGYLPFASPARLRQLLPALATFVLSQPDHHDRPDALQQLYALLQPIEGPEGAPPLRARLSTLTWAERRAIHGLVQQVFGGDEIRELWAQAAARPGSDWLDSLTRPEEPGFRRESWLESARGACGPDPDGSPDLLERDRASVAVEIEAAFDGVPAPHGGQRTLYDAENADNYYVGDVSNGRQAHRGRWQDLPFDELRDCGSALAHLGPHGLRYYAPAVMTRYLHWRESWTEDTAADLCLGLFDSIGFMLSPSRKADELRNYHRGRYSLFTAAQRSAIHAFLVDIDEDAAADWARVVAHDESGDPGPWFDVLWPDRERPDGTDVIALVRAAFDIPDPMPPHDPDREALAWLPPEQFAQRFAVDALFILGTPKGRVRERALDRMARALRPSWGADDHDEIRARLEVLTLDQRRAVSAVCDACFENSALRQMWRQASAHDGPDWFEVLKMP